MKKNILKFLITLNLCITSSLGAFAINATATEHDLDIKGSSAISYDLESKEIIYSKNIDTKTYPASITKLVTALVFAENKTPEDVLKYTQSAYDQPPYAYRLNLHPVSIGDKMSASDAMEGLLLYSGNDIAYMIADNVSGDSDKFIDAMNKKAKELKMVNSNFETANGLDDNAKNTSTTAYDLTKLMNACYNNPWIKTTMAKKEATISFVNGNKAKIENRNKLVGVDGCIAGKTGYTSKAGRCLLALYERDGRKIIGVVLNSIYDAPEDTIVFEDMKKLIDYSYGAKTKVVLNKSKNISSVDIPYKLFSFIGPKRLIEAPVYLNEDVSYYNDDIKLTQKYQCNDINPFRLSNTDSVGTLKLSQKDDSKEFKLYANVTFLTILKANWISYALALLLLIFIITMIVLIIKKITSKGNNNYS